MTTRAQLLLLDLADGCSVLRGANDRPCAVFPYPGRPIPRTRGQVADVALRELLAKSYVSSDYRPTSKGLRLIGR